MDSGDGGSGGSGGEDVGKLTRKRLNRGLSGINSVLMCPGR